MKEIINTVADFYELYPEKVFLKTRKRSIVKARQVSMYIARELTPKSFQEIGDYFKLDHATVVHSCKAVLNDTASNKEFKAEVEQLVLKCKVAIAKPTVLENEFCNPCTYGR